MNKYLLLIIGAIMIVLIGFFVVSNSRNAEQEAIRRDNDPAVIAKREFVQCLADEAVVVYGSETCPACFRFAQQFGGYEEIDPIYVECSENPEECSANMQTEFVPEIQVGGILLEVASTPENLGEVTGCKLESLE